jgi:hypothetical protein
VNGVEEDAADPATGVGGMNEQQEHLAVLGVSDCVADDAVGVVDRDQQDSRGVCSATN